MKRNSNGTGTYAKRDNGMWMYTISVGYSTQGKRIRKSFYAKTQKEAKEKAEKYLRDKSDGLNVDEKITFSDWIDEWFEFHKANITPTTQENYKYTIKALKVYFGKRQLNTIKAFDVDRFLTQLRKEGKSDSYLRQCRGMLFQVMHKAEANDLIRKNPVPFANKIKSSDKAHKKEAFSAAEVKLLMEYLPYDRMGASIRLLLGTGMRMQELLGLEPRYIAEDGSVIYVRQALKLVKGTPTIGPPKSFDSIRDVPVPQNIRWCAIQLRDTENKYIWEVGVPGQPCNPTYFRDQFKKYLEQIPGVRILTPHSCRHTYVSQMQALGVDLPTIQAIVGHADLDMTYYYLHVQDSVKSEAIAKFDAGFFSAREENPTLN